MTENVKTIPGIGDSERHGPEPDAIGGEDDPFSRTMVLDEGVAPAPARQPDDRLQPGSMLRDRYRLLERIDAGSMGVVYKALDLHLGHDGAEAPAAAMVAVKILTPELARNPEALRALQQEAAKGRCLNHPNIVRFLDLDREDDLYFIVMEWLDGRSLAELLDMGVLADDLPRILDITRQVGLALQYAHQRGVVHADIKPGNVVVLADGTVKLVDFGISRARQQDPDGDEKLAILKAATPAYASMQVLTGEEPAASDDVFSLACVAYRMIAGHRVFGPRNAAEAAESGMEPQRPDGLSDAQWKALRKGLAYARVARQSTPLAFVEELAGTAPARAAQASAAPDTLNIPNDAVIARRFEHEPSRRRWPLVLLLLLVAAAAALALRPDWRVASLETAETLIAELLERAGRVAGTVEPSEPPAAADAASVVSETTSGSAGEVPEAMPDAPVQAAADENPVPADAAPSLATDDTNDAAAASDALASGPAMRVDDEEDESAELVAALRSDAIRNIAGASASLVLATSGSEVPSLELEISEDGATMGVDLYRWFSLSEPLLLRVDEVGFSGSRSPGEDGAYRLSGDGVVSFDPGQRQATLEIEPARNEQREPDRQVSLLLRDYYSAATVFGQLELRLLDDDQRRFESGMPVNAVAFAGRSIVVRERDPAVQIDIQRFNPDPTTMSVRYDVYDVSATEGEDYFVPTRRFITFGPGQRNARLLIPLVQDNVQENDESFMIELDPGVTFESINARFAVTIRDDDEPAE